MNSKQKTLVYSVSYAGLVGASLMSRHSFLATADATPAGAVERRPYKTEAVPCT